MPTHEQNAAAFFNQAQKWQLPAPETVLVKLNDKPSAQLPMRATEGAAGYDCFVAENTMLPYVVGGTVLVSLGFSIAIPEGFVGLLIPRSSLFKKKGLRLANTIGVIDSDYRGEVMAMVEVAQPLDSHFLEQGERICQLVLMPVYTPGLWQVDELPTTERGEGGFGSTGA